MWIQSPNSCYTLKGVLICTLVCTSPPSATYSHTSTCTISFQFSHITITCDLSQAPYLPLSACTHWETSLWLTSAAATGWHGTSALTCPRPHMSCFLRGGAWTSKGTRLASECITVWQGTSSGGMLGLCQPAFHLHCILHTLTLLMWTQEHIVSVNTTHLWRQVSDVHRMAFKFQKVRGIPVCEALDSKHNWTERQLHIQSDYLTYLI